MRSLEVVFATIISQRCYDQESVNFRSLLSLSCFIFTSKQEGEPVWDVGWSRATWLQTNGLSDTHPRREMRRSVLGLIVITFWTTGARNLSCVIYQTLQMCRILQHNLHWSHRDLVKQIGKFIYKSTFIVFHRIILYSWLRLPWVFHQIRSRCQKILHTQLIQHIRVHGC